MRGLMQTRCAVWCAISVFLYSGYLAAREAVLAASPVSEIAKVAQPIQGTLVFHSYEQPDVTSVLIQNVAKAAGRDFSNVIMVHWQSTMKPTQVKRATSLWEKVGAKRVRFLSMIKSAKQDSTLLEKPFDRDVVIWVARRPAFTGKEVVLSQAARSAIAMHRKSGGVVCYQVGDQPRSVGGELDLLPGAVVGLCAMNEANGKGETKTKTETGSDAVVSALGKRPGSVGYAIKASTMVVVKGRRMAVVDDGALVVCLPKSKTRPAKLITTKRRQVVDIVAMSRGAIARSQPTFPPAKMAVPYVAKGTLVIVGGGGMPRDAMDAFMKPIGKKDSPVVVIPTALGDVPASEFDKVYGVRMLKREGFTNIKVVHAATRGDADQPANLKALATAKGIWFSGGRQWRLVDSFAGTKAEQLMHDVLKRGGVIGGSSAGATIQGEYLVRGNPLGNFDMMAEGYEKGLPFLRGVAIDQHFTQRKRHKDLENVKRTFPQLLGIGIDETTAIVVTGHTAKVMGKYKVAFYDKVISQGGKKKLYQELKAGDTYNFKTKLVTRAKSE